MIYSVKNNNPARITGLTNLTPGVWRQNLNKDIFVVSNKIQPYMNESYGNIFIISYGNVYPLVGDLSDYSSWEFEYMGDSITMNLKETANEIHY